MTAANSTDADPLVPIGALGSVSTLFAYVPLSNTGRIWINLNGDQTCMPYRARMEYV